MGRGQAGGTAFTALIISFFVGFSASAAFPELQNSPRLITDSLVKDLACSELASGEWPQKVTYQPDAFSKERHIGVKNWTDIWMGHCWALSRTQRLKFFLSRPEISFGGEAENVLEVLDVLRSGAAPLAAFSDAVWPAVHQGISRYGRTRDFSSELDFYQTRRFFQLQNILLIMGSGPRSRQDNEDTMIKLHLELSRNRLPLIVVRRSRDAQHVLLLKSMEYVTGRVIFKAYDSNIPDQDADVYYKNGQFYAPTYGPADEPVGLFLVDDGEMREIEQALTRYYGNLCRN